MPDATSPHERFQRRLEKIRGDAPSPASVGRSSAPELYGLLLSLQDKLDGGLMTPLTVGAALVNGVCLGIHLEWWRAVGPLPVEKLQSGWLYLFLNVVALLGLLAIDGLVAKRIYRRHRGLLDAGIDEAGLNRYALVTLLEGDAKLVRVAQQLKRDSRLDG